MTGVQNWHGQIIRSEHGRGRRLDSSAQVLRNSRSEFRLQSLRRTRCARRQKAQHSTSDDSLCLDGPSHVSVCSWNLLWYPLSWLTAVDTQRANCEAPERAGTDSAGNHVNILCDIRCKWYQENVLGYPESSNYDVLSRENVLGGTKFMFPRDKAWWRQELGLIRSGASQFAS